MHQPGDILTDSHFCKMSEEGLCLDGATLERIQNIAHGREAKMMAKTESRRSALERLRSVGFYSVAIQLAVIVRTRYMVRIVLKDVPHYADILTGTMHRQSGECLTSNNLRMVGEPVACGKKEVKAYLASKKPLSEAEE